MEDDTKTSNKNKHHGSNRRVLIKKKSSFGGSLLYTDWNSYSMEEDETSGTDKFGRIRRTGFFFALRFCDTKLEEAYQKQGFKLRFPVARQCTLCICAYVIFFMGMATPYHFQLHDFYHWYTYLRLLSFCWIALVAICLIISWNRFVSEAIRRRWQLFMMLFTLIAGTFFTISNAIVMEQDVFAVLRTCDIESVEELLNSKEFNTTCPSNDEQFELRKVSIVLLNFYLALVLFGRSRQLTIRVHISVAPRLVLSQLFPNWQLKNMHTAFVTYGSAITVGLQQLDCSYGAFLIMYVMILNVLVNSLAAPPQDFALYFHPSEAKIEPFWKVIVPNIVTSITAAAFAWTLNYQLSILRRQRYVFHRQSQVLRSRERQTARNVLSEHRKVIEEMEAAWKIDRSEITLIEKTGSGAQSELWKGELRRRGDNTSITVAVKKLHNDEAVCGEEEARLMMRLRHPRLVRFIGATDTADDGSLAIITEYVSGRSIERRLWGTSPQSLSNDVRFLWARDLADACAFIHEKNYVHRDIKSPNVLYCAETNRVKLADFGLGRSLVATDLEETKSGILEEDSIDASENGDRPSKSRRFSAAVIEMTSPTMTMHVGSVPWMAVELMSESSDGLSAYDQKVDVFSYGVVLWELVSHQQPWISHTNAKAIVNAVRRGERLPILPEHRALMPERYFRLMKACWDESPSKRPDFKSILNQLIEMNEHKGHRT